MARHGMLSLAWTYRCRMSCTSGAPSYHVRLRVNLAWEAAAAADGDDDAGGAVAQGRLLLAAAAARGCGAARRAGGAAADRHCSNC